MSTRCTLNPCWCKKEHLHQLGSLSLLNWREYELDYENFYLYRICTDEEHTQLYLQELDLTTLDIFPNEGILFYSILPRQETNIDLKELETHYTPYAINEV